MKVTSHKAESKRFVQVEHDSNGRAIDFAWSQKPQSETGELIESSLRFTMGDRRVCLTLTPAETSALHKSLSRCLSHHPELK
jgi:hypothetical protein